MPPGWLKRLLAISALAQSLFPTTARAQNPAAGGGLYVALSLHHEGELGFGWGVQGFTTFILDGEAQGCSSDARTGLGPVIEFGMIGLRYPRLVAAIYAGQEQTRGGLALGTELGATYRFEDPGFGLHVALLPSVGPLNAVVQSEFFLGELAVGAGVRVPSPFGQPGSCAVGRPLRGSDGIATLPEPAWGQGAPRRSIRAADSELISEIWARDAQSECASVPAFLQLAMDLVAQGAPRSLVARALHAAEQEIVHATLCAELASAYHGAKSLRPVLPSPAPRAPLLGPSGLVRLATESLLDGCLAEGAAAARAAESSHTARDRRVREISAKIANEEAEHAELGWSVLEWALTRAPNPVRDALAACRDARVSVHPDSAPQHELPNLSAHGLLGLSRAQELGRQQALRVRERLDALLA